MKKRLVLIGFCAVSTMCMAAPVSVETAKEKAAKFLTAHSALRRAVSKSELTLAYSGKDATTGAEVLYVFNRGEQEGFVIASGDDCAEPVLGFSDTGTFNADQMAPATKWWLDGYQQEIAFAARYGQHTQARRATNYADIAPMIETMWDQEAPYYNLCPIDESNGKRGWTCCVAVATAQVMYYHKWPEHGTGSHSYEWQGKTLSADFGSTTYQWDKMQKTYSSSSEDPDNAIATLMYHCGVALEVNYGGYGSYAMFNNGYVMETYFGYSPGWQWYSRDNVGDEVFEDALYNDLAQGLPVLYGGQDLNRNEGHQFVCDGYREGGYYHMNWGWSGWNDGYFLLSALNIRDGRKWNWQQEIYCGIKKPETPHEVDGLVYEKNGNSSVTLKRGSVNGDLVIPSSITIDGQQYTVTTVGSYAFSENNDITSLTIPSSVRMLKDDAFSWCKNLKSVIIEDGESSLNVGRYMFTECPIEKLYLGRTLIESEAAFMNKSSLKEVQLGESVTSLSDNEFFSTGLRQITIPASVSYIGSAAFGDCSYLESLSVLSTTPPTCEYDAFCGTTQNNAVAYVPKGSYDAYKAATGWNQLKGIMEIDSQDGESDDTNGLEYESTGANTLTLVGGKTEGSLVIPRTVKIKGIVYSVTGIKKEAFRDQLSITSLTIPNSLVYIGDYAFDGCSNMTELTIEDGEEKLTVGMHVFDFSGLQKAVIGRNVESDGGFLGYIKTLKDVTLTDHVTQLHRHMFVSTGIEAIKIPGSVTNIEAEAFSENVSLKEFIVDSSNSFYSSADGVLYDKNKTMIVRYPNAKKDQSFICPETLTTITDYAFDSVSRLESLTLPKGISLIGYGAFSFNTKLNELIVLAETPAVCNNVSFLYPVPERTVLYVPKGCSEIYKTAVGWELFATIKEIEETGIAEMGRVASLPFDVYSIDGNMLYQNVTSMQGLPKGLYILQPSGIVGNGKSAHKIVVK